MDETSSLGGAAAAGYIGGPVGMGLSLVGSLASGLLGDSAARSAALALKNSKNRGRTEMETALAANLRGAAPQVQTSYETLNAMRSMLGLPDLAYPDASQFQSQMALAPENTVATKKAVGGMKNGHFTVGLQDVPSVPKVPGLARGGNAMRGMYQLAEEGPEDLEDPHGNYMGTVYEPGVYQVHDKMNVVPNEESHGGPDAEMNGMISLLSRHLQNMSARKARRPRIPGRAGGGQVNPYSILASRFTNPERENPYSANAGPDKSPMDGADPSNGHEPGGVVGPVPGSTVGGNAYDWHTDPGYQFRLGEGTHAIENSAIARGGLLSGGTAKRLERYGQDFGSQEFGNVFNRLAGVNNASSQFLNNILSQRSGTGNALLDMYLRYGGAKAGTAYDSGQAWNNAIQGGIGNYFTSQGLGGGK